MLGHCPGLCLGATAVGLVNYFTRSNFCTMDGSM
jgi:hypothetical protein